MMLFVWQVKRFMPFLEGNRQCIGMSLAKLNYTTAVALLLSHFTFRLADDVSTFCIASSVFSQHAHLPFGISQCLAWLTRQHLPPEYAGYCKHAALTTLLLDGVP